MIREKTTAALYKVLKDIRACHGGDLDYGPYLPRNGHAGPWLPEIANLRLCERGYHLAKCPERDWYKWGCKVYKAEAKGIGEEDETKLVASSIRLLREVPHPDWWIAAEDFVAGLQAIPWFHPDGNPDPAWKLYIAPSWVAARAAAWVAARAAAGDAAWAAAGDAAWAAAGAAAWDAARDAAWAAARAAAWVAARAAAGAAAGAAAWAAARDAARDAVLYAELLICQDLPVSEHHRVHARARMEVWRKGYALLCDVNGTLYVYAASK